MFSHLVTAAKGLLTRQDAEEEVHPATPAADKNSKMVTATKRGNVAANGAAESEINGSPITNGTPKSTSGIAGKKKGQNNKRRRSSVEVSGEVAQDKPTNGVAMVNGKSGSNNEKTGSREKSGHIRFGSEEPVLPEVQTDGVPEAGQDNQEDEDESSDDDAPETIDNSAQLSKIKLEAQKREQARQREEQLKKEKRKQLDEQHKIQAKLANKKKEVSNADEILSESTETLQGSITQDTRRPGLPALLPDDILNSTPAERLPAPPLDDFTPVHKKANKLKFLDKSEKRPKDVTMDDRTIRVLDDGPSRKKAKTMLPPKASKTGRNSKENWLKNPRNTANVNGLRRTTGGPSSFVRK